MVEKDEARPEKGLVTTQMYLFRTLSISVCVNGQNSRKRGGRKISGHD